MHFKSFNLHPKIAAGALAAGYTSPTPIQAQAIPKIMQHRDVIGLAQTGTGKTAAFGLPVLHHLMKGRGGCVRTLIMAPTRELAQQIHEALELLGSRSNLRSITLYGGVSIHSQILKLRQGADIVIACPGRLLDHIHRSTIDLRNLEVLVLDEADQMLDMGFLPDIRRIIKQLPAKRQTLLFSATMSKGIRQLAQDILNNPEMVQTESVAPAKTVSHALYPVAPNLKTNLLLRLLKEIDAESVLVFTRTKHRAKRLGEKLEKCGYQAATLQGNLSQSRRQTALEGFRNGRFKIMVATDIAARGIDVSRVSHVINFDMPDTAESYIHRIGRTGRACRQGDAFTMVAQEDTGMVKTIERTLGTPIERRRLTDFDYGDASLKISTSRSRNACRPRR